MGPVVCLFRCRVTSSLSNPEPVGRSEKTERVAVEAVGQVDVTMEPMHTEMVVAAAVPGAFERQQRPRVEWAVESRPGCT